MSDDFTSERKPKQEETEMETDDICNQQSHESQIPERSSVYLPNGPIEPDEHLTCDRSAYVALHQFRTGSPCLSFDVLYDSNLQDWSDQYPLTLHLVAGTQSPQSHNNVNNNVIVMKLTGLNRNCEDSSESESDDDDTENVTPKMSVALMRHPWGCVNRIRSTKINGIQFAGSWSEDGRVNIWNLSEQLSCLEDGQKTITTTAKPLQNFTGHQTEGFAIDWSSNGLLATGDCHKDIFIWKPSDSNNWCVDHRPLVGHKASVEDIQWSPQEPSVLSSCSIDRTIRIWDIRAPPSRSCMLVQKNAHEQGDINVISWNPAGEPFLVSGGDDGFLHIWDLRQFGETCRPVATFKHHKGPVTTVDWHPTDSGVFASGGADDQIALWDLSVEKDDSEEAKTDEQNDLQLANLPPQLMFVHMGQKEIKELRWHPQIPGLLISTALSDFNVFRTISI